MDSQDPPQDPPTHSIEKLQNLLKFIRLLEDPTRMRIILLFLLYHRISLTELSRLLNRTKPAVLYQLNKFAEIGLIRISQDLVKEFYTANFYELIPEFMNFATIDSDPTKAIPHEIIKEWEILEFQAEKEVFKLSSNMLLLFAELLGSLEKKAEKIKEPFGFHHPPFNLTLRPLSKTAYQYYTQEIKNVAQKALKLMEEENEREDQLLERPWLLLNVFLPVKDLLDSTAD